MQTLWWLPNQILRHIHKKRSFCFLSHFLRICNQSLQKVLKRANKKFFIQKFNMGIKKRRISHWFRIRWKSLEKCTKKLKSQIRCTLLYIMKIERKKQRSKKNQKLKLNPEIDNKHVAPWVQIKVRNKKIFNKSISKNEHRQRTEKHAYVIYTFMHCKWRAGENPIKMSGSNLCITRNETVRFIYSHDRLPMTRLWE